MENKFEEIYRKYSSLEENVKNSKKNIKIISNILIVLCLIITFYLMFQESFSSDDAEFYLKMGAGISLLIYGQRAYRIRMLNGKYKQAVIPELLSLINSNLTYNARAGHTEDEFRKAEIYNGSVDRYRSSDLMQGMIDKTFMKISYITLENKERIGKTTTYIPVFTGTLVTLDFNKYFTGKTKVYTNNFFNKLGDIFSFLDDRYEKITVENQDFNSSFTIYTTDIQEALYILSPEIIEHIIKLKSFDKLIKEITITFIDNKMYIAFPGMQFLDMEKKENVKEQIKLFYYEINYIVSLVEILELNNRIWSKK